MAPRPPFSPFPPDTPRLPFSLVLCSWEGHSGPDKNALGPGLLSSCPAHNAREAVSQGSAKVLSASPGGSPSRSARACGHRPGFAAVSGLQGSALRPGLAAHGLSLPVHPCGRREPRCFPEKRRRGESSSVQLLGPGQPHCSWLRKGPGPAGPTGMCVRTCACTLVSGYSCACVYAYVRACVHCVQSVHAHTACLGGLHLTVHSSPCAHTLTRSWVRGTLHGRPGGGVSVTQRSTPSLSDPQFPVAVCRHVCHHHDVSDLVWMQTGPEPVSNRRESLGPRGSQRVRFLPRLLPPSLCGRVAVPRGKVSWLASDTVGAFIFLLRRELPLTVF